MNNVILINGLLTYDSGKTWFTIALARVLKRNRYNVVVYKPIAGHSAWHQFSTIIESLRYRILVGEDVLMYKKLLKLNVNIELINPIDVLLAPPNPEMYKDVMNYLNALEDLFSQIVLSRISDWKSKTSTHYIISDNVKKIVPGLRSWIIKLVSELSPKEVSLTSFVHTVLSNRSLEILNYNLRMLLKEYDIVLIESFNDVAIPSLSLLDKVDIVFTITPGYVFLLNVKEFKSLVREYYSKYGDVGLKMRYLLRNINVLFSTPIPPSNSPIELSYHLEKLWKIRLDTLLP